MLIDLDRELQRIDTLLDTLESARNESVKASAARFVIEEILDDENVVTYQIAANYLAWVIANGVPKDEGSKSCKCTLGWFEKPDGTVYPCERCRPEQHEKWWSEEVDEDWEPT